MVPKHEQEARFLFGVFLRRDEQGNHVGDRFTPFEYTSKNVLGVAAFEKAVKAEVSRVNNLAGDGQWGKAKHGPFAQLPGGRYQLRRIVKGLDEEAVSMVGTTRITLDRDYAAGESFEGTYNGLGFLIPFTAAWSKGQQLDVTVPPPPIDYLLTRGLGWRQEVTAILKKGSPGHICVTELMDHVINEGNLKFADTPFKDDWLIYHDHLSQWWEKGAQQHLASRGFLHRQVRCLGETNKGTRYEGNLVGNRYELMPLDNNLFSDLKDTNRQHVIATANLAVDDPRRFKMGTPTELSASLLRTWQVAPTPERIVQDIQRWPGSIKAIIEHKGALVPHMRKRNGRRAVRKSQGVRVLHPDAKEAMEQRFKVWEERLASV
mmetsp:Transcript_5851/g.15257  ORF Transcript_5851/g.15257 Transcript_5851/m.15257 type:complete len:376 (-) Transcript_5851:191-1318(-)